MFINPQVRSSFVGPDDAAHAADVRRTQMYISTEFSWECGNVKVINFKL